MVPARLQLRLVFVAGLSVILLITLLSSGHDRFALEGFRRKSHAPQSPPVLPSSYDDVYEFERNLPQHDVSLPFPEGAEGRYLFAGNHIWGLGWCNVLQEHLLNALLAYSSGRAFVFDPYKWDWDESKNWTDYNGHMIPSRIPMNALISGPAAGGPFFDPFSDVPDPTPRAVTREYWNIVCPNRTIISGEDMEIREADAQTILDKWVIKLNGIEDRCVEIQGGTSQIFNIITFGSPRILTIWPTLSKSPILTRFSWSPLVLSAIHSNAHLFTPTKSSPPSELSHPAPHVYSSLIYPSNWSSGLLAVHLRRGDFSSHCEHLSNWSSTYHGWAQFPGVSDRFEAPDGGGMGWNTPENKAIYMKSCWPTIPQIVQKIVEVKRMWKSGVRVSSVEDRRERIATKDLKKVFIMTNGKRDWIEALKIVLLEGIPELEVVFSSHDLDLNLQQQYIGQAIDMGIAERADVFIGNGFSSLSGNTVMLRIAKAKAPATNHFWS